MKNDSHPEPSTVQKPILLSNDPVWTTLTREVPSRTHRGFQEAWYLKVNDPVARKALWLRFTILCTANGFKRVAETWAILFSRNENNEITKTALKQTHDVSAFTVLQAGQDTNLRIAECELTPTRTRGVIQSKGKTIRWDLEITSGHQTTFNQVPESLARLRLIQNQAVTVQEDLRFTGSCEIDGQRIRWESAPGMQGHLSGSKNAHSWVWGHCNTFVNEQGEPVPFIFDGLTSRARIAGNLAAPRLSSFYFFHRGQDYQFNSLWDGIRCRSNHNHTDWFFQADRGEISFRGHAKAEHRDFAGVTYEDTDGSFLYCANSKFSDMTLLVYRRQKLETTLYARGSAALEVVTRTPNPYVPLLI